MSSLYVKHPPTHIEAPRPSNMLKIQTKFTPTRGFKSEDLPYNTSLSLSEQVRSSVESSLHNLRPTTSTSCSGENSPYVDCLILHVPLPTAFAMLEVWTTMESYHPYRVRNLGLSNVTLQVLRWVYEVSTVKPSLVQNRWCAETGYDVAVRTYCAEHGIVYQAYGILTKSLLLASEPVQELAELANVSRATSLYYLVIQMGVVVLNGTRDDQKMISDHIEFRKLRRLANQPESQETWSSILDRFGYLLAARA